MIRRPQLRHFLMMILLLPLAATAQTVKGKVIDVALIPKDGFPFSKEWAYPWYVVHKEDGSFEHSLGEPVKAADTAHLYFTASCETNVQGLYTIRYCNASRSGDTLKLVFEDGLPAYASSFEVTVYKGSFTVVPHLVYPSPRKVSPAKVLEQSLTLTVNRYGAGGYINYSFRIEGSEEPYYLRGFFNTPLPQQH